MRRRSNLSHSPLHAQQTGAAAGARTFHLTGAFQASRHMHGYQTNGHAAQPCTVRNYGHRQVQHDDTPPPSRACALSKGLVPPVNRQPTPEPCTPQRPTKQRAFNAMQSSKSGGVVNRYSLVQHTWIPRDPTNPIPAARPGSPMHADTVEQQQGLATSKSELKP